MKIQKVLPIGFVLLLLGAFAVYRFWPSVEPAAPPPAFDGQKALEDVQYQVSLGPRLIGTAAHNQTVDWIQRELKAAGWKTELQESVRAGVPIRNIQAEWGQGNPWVLVGAHFDSRLLSDQDPIGTNRTTPVPGANDGASGVGVLLELARVLPAYLTSESRAQRVTLVFFDAEDNGRIQGADWIMGSTEYAARLTDLPDAVVIVDMIGDADLNIYQEQNSDPGLNAEIWAKAAELGYEQYFIPQMKYRILDDHMPFIQLGIPAVDLIDFDYPYWHTTQDTADKVSAESLAVVGNTLVRWLSDGDE